MNRQELVEYVGRLTYKPGWRIEVLDPPSGLLDLGVQIVVSTWVNMNRLGKPADWKQFSYCTALREYHHEDLIQLEISEAVLQVERAIMRAFLLLDGEPFHQPKVSKWP